MKLYHVSPARNDESIHEHGLLALMSKCPKRGIYLCDRARVDRELDSCRIRNPYMPMSVWVVEYPKRYLTHLATGQYVRYSSIPPENIRGKLAVTSDGEVLV